MALNNTQKKFLDLANKLTNIKNMPYDDKTRKNYDKKGFIYDIEYTLGQLEYFFDTIVPSQGGTPNSSYYYLKKLDPKEHQIAYVNLTRGFPKELFGGHYCYIFKKFKDKYVVIPTTSVDDPEADKIQNFEIEIDIKNFHNDKITRLNVSNIRAIDIQSIYQPSPVFESEKGIFDVLTDRDKINKKIVEILCNIHID